MSKPQGMSLGTCHRCGWKRPVAKPRLSQRGWRHPLKAYGRLCADCARDLSPDADLRDRGQSTTPPEPLEVRAVI